MAGSCAALRPEGLSGSPPARLRFGRGTRQAPAVGPAAGGHSGSSDRPVQAKEQFALPRLNRAAGAIARERGLPAFARPDHRQRAIAAVDEDWPAPPNASPTSPVVRCFSLSQKKTQPSATSSVMSGMMTRSSNPHSAATRSTSRVASSWASTASIGTFQVSQAPVAPRQAPAAAAVAPLSVRQRDALTLPSDEHLHHITRLDSVVPARGRPSVPFGRLSQDLALAADTGADGLRHIEGGRVFLCESPFPAGASRLHLDAVLAS